MTKPIILITGCSTGIGLYCARELHRQGLWRVIASCRHPSDVERLRLEGLECIALDLSESSSIKTGVEQLLSMTNGRIDALFNNGAYGQAGAVEDLSRGVLEKQFQSNFFGWVELTNLLLPIFIQQGYGRIIQNSSVLGLVAMPFRGAYNASKFALEGLTDTLRQELHGTGVHISLIEPGPILSDFRKNALKSLDNIDTNNSRHREGYKTAIDRLSKSGPAAPFTLGPEACFEKLEHALTSKHPKARYYVTFPTYLFAFLRRLVPLHWLDGVLRKAGN